MAKTKQRILILLVAFVMTLGAFSICATQNTYAASKTLGKVTGLKIVKRDSNAYTGAVTISWNKVKGAKCYQVYCYQGEDEDLGVTTVYGKTKLKTQQSFNTCKYKVRAVNGKKRGKFSNLKTFTISKTKFLKPKNNIDTISVNVGEEFSVCFDVSYQCKNASLAGTNTVYAEYLDWIIKTEESIVKFKALRSGTFDVTLTDTKDPEYTATVKVIIKDDSDSISCNVDALNFTSYDGKSIKVTFKHDNCLCMDYPDDLLNQYDSSKDGNVYTWWFKPWKSGSGTIVLYDYYNPSNKIEIPVTVNLEEDKEESTETDTPSDSEVNKNILKLKNIIETQGSTVDGEKMLITKLTRGSETGEISVKYSEKDEELVFYTDYIYSKGGAAFTLYIKNPYNNKVYSNVAGVTNSGMFTTHTEYNPASYLNTDNYVYNNLSFNVALNKSGCDDSVPILLSKDLYASYISLLENFLNKKAGMSLNDFGYTCF